MIETATFSMFHRARPRPEPAAPVGTEPLEDRLEGEQGALADELPGRLVQQIRARRQAARERMLAPDGWSEPDGLLSEADAARHDAPSDALEAPPPAHHGEPHARAQPDHEEFVEPAPDIYELGSEDLGLEPRAFEGPPELAEPLAEPGVHTPQDFAAPAEPPVTHLEHEAHHPAAAMFEPVPAVFEPEAAVFEPEPAVTHPEPEAHHPSPDMVKPAPAVFEPAPHVAHPEHEAPHPARGLFERAPEGFEAEPSVTHPGHEAHRPSPGLFEPAAELFEAEPPVTHPEHEALHPAPHLFEPAPETFEPEPLVAVPEHQPVHPDHAADIISEPHGTHVSWAEPAEPLPDELEYPSEPVPLVPTHELEPPAPLADEPAPVYLEPAPARPPPEAAPEAFLEDERLGETVALTPVEGRPPEWAPPAVLHHQYRSDPLALEYQLLGLANPLVCTVVGTIGAAEPIRLSMGRTGIYRPEGFRAAPWSGFAYDLSSDGRNGFVVGTRILTARGEIAVEQLIPGDSALALRGPALLPILWIGRSIAEEAPVEIAAGAFGPDRPRKTLCVGADHAIFMQTFPVAARELVNGSTIRRLDQEGSELFHIDVGPAEVLLAEGIPLASGRR